MAAVICAPDVEKIPGTKGTDSQLKKVFKMCRQKHIPIIFGLTKRRLAGVLGEPARQVSLVAVMNSSGKECS